MNSSSQSQPPPTLVKVTRDSLSEVTSADIEGVRSGKFELHVKIPCEIRGSYRNPAVDPSVKIRPGESIEDRLAEIQELSTKACLKCPNRSEDSTYIYDETGAAIYDASSNKCACKPGFSGDNCDINELAAKLRQGQNERGQVWQNVIAGVGVGLLVGAAVYFVVGAYRSSANE